MVFLCIACGKNLDENRFYRKVKNRCKDCLNKKFKFELCEKSCTKKMVENSYRTKTSSEQI